MRELRARALDGLPEIERGADLAALILERGAAPGEHDVLVVAHKVISKAEGRVRELAAIEPGARALELADSLGKDARRVQAVLDESSEVVRAERGVLIVRTAHGFVCANAGIDESNAASDGLLTLLPIDPDRSARALRARLRELSGRAPAVVISDSFGRAWRLGQIDTAIGCAGLRPLDDWRGRRDRRGRELHASVIAIADAVAAAADLTRGKDSGEPVVIVSGLDSYVSADDGPGALALVRPAAEDLFAWRS
jgi:coenzyme F420-0:L-glutamate ligase / coenzyme F420-1:gamma-L-glutamate ligase